MGYTGRTYRPYPYQFTGKRTIATTISGYTWVCYLDINIGAAGIIPKRIAWYWRVINRCPCPVYQILNPYINIRGLTKTEIRNVGIKPSICIGVQNSHLSAAIKIRPEPGPQAKPGMKHCIIFSNSFPDKVQIT